MSADGSLFIEGRDDATLNLGGHKATAEHIESILTDQLTAAIYGKVTPQQALDNAASKAAPILGTGGTPSPSG